MNSVLKIKNTMIGIAMLAFPTMSMVGFLMHFKNIGDFFNFTFQYIPLSAQGYYEKILGADGFHLFTLPHAVAAISIVLLLPAMLYLANSLIKRKSWFGLIGGVFSFIGIIGEISVFAIWLSFSSWANLPKELVGSGLPYFQNAIAMTGVLRVVTVLALFNFVGIITMSIGMMVTKITSKITPILLILSSILFVVFMDLDNWMFIASSLMLIAFFPIALKLLKGEDPFSLGKTTN